jgi:pimeloyl-ACP methyl ester carboxylesterase
MAGLFAIAVAFGALVADPLRFARWTGETTLRRTGGREEFFRGPSGERLRTWVVGSGSVSVPVVLLHGLGAASDYWAVTTRALARSGRTVIIPDAPGSGASEKPGGAGWGLDARVAAVRSLVEALGLKSFDLVGHSLGGWTAARLAIDEPRLIRHLVLVDPGGFSLPEDGDLPAFRMRFAPTDRKGGRDLLDLLFFRKPFPGPGFVSDALARSYNSPTVSATVSALRKEDGLIGKEPDLPEGTALIWGERESLFPLEDGRRAASLLRNGRFFILTGVGHDGPLEAPRPFNDLLVTLLRDPPPLPSKP